MTVVQSRESVRERVVVATRGAVLLGGLEPLPWDEVGAAAGVSPRSLRALFRDEDDLWDAVTEHLVGEAAQRLAAVDTDGSSGAPDPLAAARMLADAVIRARPLDRGGLLVRLERRARALRSARPRPATRAAEGRFLRELGAQIGALLGVVGREPALPLHDVTRILLNTYERAFEAWLAAGRAESRFHESRFALDTLPTLILALSRPRAAGAPTSEE